MSNVIDLDAIRKKKLIHCTPAEIKAMKDRVNGKRYRWLRKGKHSGKTR